jgi:uncharacterized membrane protein YcaP (DUF421 family)
MSDLLATPLQLGLIVLRTIVVYLFILVGFRLSGKREVGQMAPFDFALILLIANAVQNAMVGPDTSLLGGLMAAFMLLALNAILGRLAVDHRGVERLLRGRARVLVSRGRINMESLVEEGLAHEDLMQALREHGVAAIEDCRLAVLETDGTISVIEKKASDRP